MSRRDSKTAAERAVERLRRQGYKPIEECDLTPEQRAFAEGFQAGWNACAEHHEELINEQAARAPDDKPRLH